MVTADAFLGVLRGLSTVAEMRRLARRDYAPAARPKANAHIHLPPNFSAFADVRQAVSMAAQQGVGVLGASNYYDFTVYGEFAGQAQRRGIFPLFGVEIVGMIGRLRDAGVKVNDPGNPGKIYICGKGITAFSPPNAAAAHWLEVIRRNDAARMAQMVEAMERVFAVQGLPTGITGDQVVDMIVRRHGAARPTVYLQERHVAQAFQEAAFAKLPPGQRLEQLSVICGATIKVKAPDDAAGVQNELRTHLLKAGKPAFVEERFIDLGDAERLILEMGGIPCYPVLADGATPICGFETPVESLIEQLRTLGIHAAEFIPVRNAPEVLEKYVTAMRAAGLVVTAGTEHNTLDLIGLDPACKGGTPIPENLRAIFWEGACVVAAHQFLSLHGQIGFVTAAGEPNPKYDTADARIRGFARLGAAVIRRHDDLTAQAASAAAGRGTPSSGSV